MATNSLAPQTLNYETTVVCPETIYNCYKAIRSRIDHDPEAGDHAIIKVTYALDFGAPSHRFVRIIDHMLERDESIWRLHSLHVEVPSRTIKVLLRKHSLVDLVEDDGKLTDYELKLPALMEKFAITTGKQEIPNAMAPEKMELPWNYYMLRSPSSLRIFKLDEGKYYYVYRCYFDLWEYSDDQPDAGWRSIE